jgi:DNA-binding response OmpR family regulator
MICAACLVIEDEPQLRSMLADNLEFDGYSVTAVASGEEAFARSPTSLFAVAARRHAARDQRLRVCRTLRAQGTRVPIILLTAAPTSAIASGPRPRADDYVSKPFGVHELLPGCARKSAATTGIR